jgi:hypothetical protein
MNVRAFVVMHCADTGEVALIPVRGKESTNTINNISFVLGAHKKSVWVYKLGRHVRIDNPIPLEMKDAYVLACFSTKRMIFCAFSSATHAMQCLSRWQETNGMENLSPDFKECT